MKRIFCFFLLLNICLFLYSCGKEEEPFFSVDNTAPVIAEVTAVTTPTNDNTPNYTFSSDEAGSIAFEGPCSSSNTSADEGHNTITLNSLSDGTYSDCAITVTDKAANESNSLTLTSFFVDSTASTLVETTAIASSTNDSRPDYTFVSSEAGTITYSGSCSSSTTSVIAGTNIITFNSLSEGTYSDCKITVTDSLGNAVTLNIGSFVIDTTEPTIAHVTAVTTPTNDSTPNYTFSSDEAGTITYGGSCSSSTTSAVSGNNNITFNILSDGTYSNCTITITDLAGHGSNTVTIPTFILDSTAATLAEVTAVSRTTATSPEYTFSSSEAGTITYSGSCSSSTTSATTDNNTITLRESDNSSLDEGTYSDCKITVTDNISNSVTLNISSFVIDTSGPAVSSINPDDNQSGVMRNKNISVTFSEAMDTTSVTTNTDNTTCYGSFQLSSDNFSTCVQMSSAPSSSNSDKTFTVVPSAILSAPTTYKARVTTGVKDVAKNVLNSQAESVFQGTAFTMKPWTKPYVNGIGLSNDLYWVISHSESNTSWVLESAGCGGNQYKIKNVDSARYTRLRVGSNNQYSLGYIVTGSAECWYVELIENQQYRIFRSLDNGTEVFWDAIGGPNIESAGSTLSTSKFIFESGSGSYVTSNGFTTSSTPLMGGSIQDSEMSYSNLVTTFAGAAGSSATTDGTGTSARFTKPNGITTDGTNLYVAQSNHTIRKIVISSGVVTTLAGTADTQGTTDATGTAARFYTPHAITTDGANLYVADLNNHTIRKIVISSGVVTTLAGSAGSSGSTDGTGTSAKFNEPAGITTDGNNLYVGDMMNHTIRKVVISNGVVTTLAGSAGNAGSTDATGTSARFNHPMKMTTDGNNLYVGDYYNHKIRKIVISSGVVSTLAGSSTGTTDGTGTGARFFKPRGLTTDGTNLYVSDTYNHTIRKIVISSGVVTTLAGTAGSIGSTDATGTSAMFKYPMGLTTDGTNLYVGDLNNHTIRKFSKSASSAFAIALGVRHTCALMGNGAVKCWGYNEYGQLGIDNTTNMGDDSGEMALLTGINLRTGRTATAISAGYHHSCALLDNASVKCWGLNTRGQHGIDNSTWMGDNSGEMAALPVVNLGTGRTATAIDAGHQHPCALLDNGSVKCWGYNNFGQLGIGSTENMGDDSGEMAQLTGINLGTGRTATATDVGGYHTCALLDNASVKCWGQNYSGQLGLGDNNDRGDQSSEMGDNLPVVDLGSGRTATAIATGHAYTCALLDNASVKCWGHNTYGQLGIGSTTHMGDNSSEMGDNLPVVNLGTGRTATAIAARHYHSCAILDDATVKCWGKNTRGQLGIGSTTHMGDNSSEMGDNLPVVNLGTGRTATAIATGDDHTCAILDNASIKCWGGNHSGQLGTENTTHMGDDSGEMGDNLPAIDF